MFCLGKDFQASKIKLLFPSQSQDAKIKKVPFAKQDLSFLFFVFLLSFCQISKKIWQEFFANYIIHSFRPKSHQQPVDNSVILKNQPSRKSLKKAKKQITKNYPLYLKYQDPLKRYTQNTIAVAMRNLPPTSKVKIFSTRKS